MKARTSAGRGTLQNPPGRFAERQLDASPEFLDDWPEPSLSTVLSAETARSVISTNNSPDLNFQQSVNPYRGCEHGCVYCYARPAHAYLDLSPGLDFETQIVFKPNAAEVLRKQLNKSSYQCKTISLGANTDPYQPAEKKLRITRELLKVLWEYRHPVAIVTKSALIERDLDLLKKMARENLVQVMISVTTLSKELKRTLEPRAASPTRRLQCIQRLTEAGISTGILLAPVIPGLNDHEIDAILREVARAGATQAGYVLLRLPYEVRQLFGQWLAEHHPDQEKKIMSLLRQHRGGQTNDPCFGSRMRGTGPLADLLNQRFTAACRRHGLDCKPTTELKTRLFKAPDRHATQLSLL